MIAKDYITAWRLYAPWVSDHQVEQDLVISRALAQIFAAPAVALVAVIFLGEKIKMKEIIALAFVALGTLAVQLKRFARVPPTRESLEQRK